MSTESSNPSELKEELQETAAKVFSDVQDRASDLKDKTSDLIERAGCAVREKSCCVHDKAQDLIRRKPLPTVVGFAALGFAIGYLVCQRRRQPLFDSDEIASVFTPLGKRLREGYRDLRHRGSDAFESVQSRVPDHALDKVIDQARSFGQNLKFW